MANTNIQGVGPRQRGSTANLRRPEYGFVFEGPGIQASPRTLPATTSVTIAESETNVVPRWPNTPTGSSRTEHRYKVQHTLTETYDLISYPGPVIPIERQGGLIPHHNLSEVKNGTTPRNNSGWQSGEHAFLITRHAYTETGGQSVTIEAGERVRISSGPRTKNTISAHNYKKGLYSFQRTKESKKSKTWTSAEKIHEAYIL